MWFGACKEHRGGVRSNVFFRNCMGHFKYVVGGQSKPYLLPKSMGFSGPHLRNPTSLLLTEIYGIWRKLRWTTPNNKDPLLLIFYNKGCCEVAAEGSYPKGILPISDRAVLINSDGISIVSGKYIRVCIWNLKQRIEIFMRKTINFYCKNYVLRYYDHKIFILCLLGTA